ncbi:hypothetical protein, partial [Paraburkholderia sp.]|uniref:hypothetical protein n=1 Tax=Paraburkholderia sp. TaxID=1926495 RepID=UPI003C7A4F81
MKIDRSTLGLTKESSSHGTTPASPNAAIPFAHYLGLGGAAEAAKSIPSKASAAVSRMLGKTSASASRQTPKLSNAPVQAATVPAPVRAAGPSVASQIEQAVKAERTRAAEILVAGIKAGRVNQACSLAFDSSLSARQAIAALSAAVLDDAASSPDRRSRRMGLDPDQPSGSTSRRAPTTS